MQKPMLAQSTTIEKVKEGFFDTGEWFAEKKYDGVRVIVSDGKLFSRRGKDITEKFPELKEVLNKIKNIDSILDGELISQTEKFEDISSRIHTKEKLFIKLLSKSKPAKLMIFDVVVAENMLMVNPDSEQDSRKAWLQLIKRRFESEFCQVVGKHNKPSELLEQAINEGWEGIMIKSYRGNYESKRSWSWRKAKCFKETEYTFSEFEEHDKGILLKDSKHKVNVNGQEAKFVKEQIENNGKVKVQIQYMEQPNSNKWRFPSYRGIVKEGTK